MVASIDQLASGAGVAVLRAGGTAADAAVAASAVLAVTAQHTCGMGGDLWALVHFADGEPPAALNAAGRAGSGADPQRLRDEGHAEMPLWGDPRSIPVPGCVDGWLALHDRFGRRPLAEVLGPAIELAEHGFPLSPQNAAAAEALVGVAGADDYLGADGRVPRAGTLIRRPGVAQALRAVRDGGRRAFYEGEFGEDLLELGRGEYAESDLATPLADWVEPLSAQAWGHRVWTVPPSSQGYLTAAAAWIADGLDVPADVDDPAAVHLLAEAALAAAFDRVDVLHEHADGAALISPERLAPRRAAIGADVWQAGRGEHEAGACPANSRAGDTNYLAVVDGGGTGSGGGTGAGSPVPRMGVSLIQSNASGWGARCFLGRSRISLHNRGLGFSLEAGHPAEYGPGRRPPHTLAPALVQTAAGALRTVLGTMGGDAQPQVVLQLLARLLHGGATPAQAVAAGRWRWDRPQASAFQTWVGTGRPRLLIEGHAGTDGAAGADGAAGGDDTDVLVSELAGRGHDVRREASFDSSFGHAHVIEVDGDVLAGASDPRALNGAALGF
ncbi:MAG TPA: gamma-glutamyltranspeptidase [Acidimicrobiaceae bacterium]|nr:gamma-glutamyltranspeptidase [Acidimicrobiaceae bacterium]HCB37663.1 gamma-glutamyltranspeptidase [Acidimicrobiaceae bacterium]